MPDFLTGCGIWYTALDENGIPVIACIDERTITAMEKIHMLFDLPNCTLSYDQASSGRDMSGYRLLFQKRL